VKRTIKIVEDTRIDERIKEAHLTPHLNSRLDSAEEKIHPMMDESISFRDISNFETKIKSLRRLIEQLNVIKSIRYQRTEDDTYCNVYAYDYCYFAGVYLPRIWWTDNALTKILNGQDVKPIFEKTVDHIYSSAIHDWFLKWGASFGWKRMYDLDAIQHKVNTEGGVAIICAKRKIVGLSGHIVPIVPETDKKKAFRENGIVVYPLQSQAGKLNYNYFAKARKDWWNHERYSSHVFYYHD
jgi:hypothetical protein